MQSERGQGFLLIAPSVYPEEEYQELKVAIEKICRKAEDLCIESNVDNLNFAILAKDDIFITVSVRERKAQFALYDMEQDRLIQNCTINQYKQYVNQFRLDMLSYRIENECRAVEKGSILSRKNLDVAWNEKYQNEQQNIDRNLMITHRRRR